MTVWLNDLKEGDIFYHIIYYNVYKCKHLGDAGNINFRMPRIKFEILDNTSLLKEVFGSVHEAFVNQYVYDDYDSAVEQLKEELQIELKKTKESIKIHKKDIKTLEEHQEYLNNLILTYAKQDLEKNITES